jgi:hypothetical protein
MKSKDIFLIILIIVAAGFSIYRKYVKKNQQGTGGFSRPDGRSSQADSKDDDYEPYSGK